jgi:surface antigen
VSDEQSPNPMADLFANQNATSNTAAPHTPAPLVPASPQFSSRREMRDAAAHNRRTGTAGSNRASSKNSAKSSKREASSARKPSRSPKLSRKEIAIARKLAVTPPVRIVAPKKVAKRQHPVLGVLVVLVVSGFVALVTMPAYAFTPVLPGSVQAAVKNSAHNLQALQVDATIQAPKVSRDAMHATSDAEYKAQQISATTLLAYSSVGPHQAGDDYPWASAGYGLSPLNYYYRQCVDFVAWRLNRDAGVTSAPWKWTWSTLTPNGGDASQWKAAWEAHNWKTSATPVVGSVAWFVGNHVAYVKSISGSNVVIEEYNGTSSRSYAMRTIPIDTVGRFLYPPP